MKFLDQVKIVADTKKTTKKVEAKVSTKKVEVKVASK